MVFMTEKRVLTHLVCNCQVKRLALKAAIMAMLSGERMPKVLMQVIRFCINTNDHQLKKLMMLYWEGTCYGMSRLLDYVCPHGHASV